MNGRNMMMGALIDCIGTMTDAQRLEAFRCWDVEALWDVIEALKKSSASITAGVLEEIAEKIAPERYRRGRCGCCRGGAHSLTTVKA